MSQRLEYFICFLIIFNLFGVLLFLAIRSILKEQRKEDEELVRQEQARKERERQEQARQEMARREQIRQENFVREKSRKLQLIQKLNESSKFYDIPKVVRLTKPCRSKREFETVDLRGFFIGQISVKREYYHDLITKTRNNKSTYDSYLNAFSNILKTTPSDERIYSEYSFFSAIEDRCIETQKLKPTTALTICVTKYYTSQQGRSSYSEDTYFKDNEVVACFLTALAQEESRQSTQNERDLMTPTLRYKVLQRDGFRCVLCGASAQDGVKLHVDHIYPVSKGGKTEMSNLRTLCDRCNFGKGARYDPNGPN